MMQSENIHLFSKDKYPHLLPAPCQGDSGC